MNAPLDLDGCAQEPIRIPGGVQPHGVLLALSPADLSVLQASANVSSLLTLKPGVAQAEQLEDFVGGDHLARDLKDWLAREEGAFLRTCDMGGRVLQVLGHRNSQGAILEFENPPASERETFEALYPLLRGFMDDIAPTDDVNLIAGSAARLARELTGFNRVMIYRFDPDWHGVVIAEDGDGVLPSYLDLRFPASDIPAQARELYRLNRLRLIPDANYTPASLEPVMSPTDGQPLDLSFAALRSVSPIHLQYMRNMGTLSSMSISILVEGKLWGLISCHSAKPRLVNAQVRAVCDFLGQIVSLQIGARERAAFAAERIELKRIETRLLAELARADNYRNGLAEHPSDWLELAGASGAAVIAEGEIKVVGATPPIEHLSRLAAWLQNRKVDEIFASDNLAKHWPDAEMLAETAAGILAISISQIHASYIVWFRPEVLRTVTWGGDPRKGNAGAAAQPLSPRASFERWKEQVRLRSNPWREAEIETARDFRNAVISFVLKRAEEKAELTEALQRTNKELESFSYSVSHDLRAPFRHIVGFSELLGEREKSLDEKSRHYLDSIKDAALSAGRLVDDLLNFSHMGRTSLNLTRVDMDKLVREVRHSLEPDAEGRAIEWDIQRLPPAWGDGAMLRQVLANLLDNAIKYTRDAQPAKISITGEERARDTLYRVADNGVGFDMAYVDKLFGVFQRLHRVEDFEGTGIGLALSKRVIDRHAGDIFAEGTPGGGAAFTFVLPKR